MSCVLVTGIGGNIGLDLARNLKRASHRVVGTDVDPLNLELGRRVADSVYLIPRASERGFVEAFNTICERESVSLAFSHPDVEIQHIVAHRDSLAAPCVSRRGVSR